MNTYPLTETQLGMFLDWNADRASTQYSLAYGYRLPKSVDPDRLEAAFRSFVNSHPVFRTRLVETDDGVRQGSDPDLAITFRHERMSAVEADRLDATFPRPFDPFSEAPVRFLFVHTPEDVRLYVELLHLITDGTSIDLFTRGVSALYDGRDPGGESRSFADYAATEATSFDTPDYRAAEADAKARFAGRAMTTPEGTRNAKAASAPRSGRDSYITVSSRFERGAIESFCRENAIHPNLFFMGVFARALALYANERDVVFYAVNHGRRDPSLATTLGALVKTVPVRSTATSATALADYLAGFRLHRAGVYPFGRFCRDLGIAPGWGFVYQEGTLRDSLTLGGVEIPSRVLMGGGAGEWPVLQLFGERDGYRLALTQSASGRYAEPFLAGFAERCATIARAFAAADARAPLGDIPTLAPDELASALERSSGEELEYDAATTFLDLFAAQVASRPDATAVVDATSSLTYRELGARSDALADELLRRGAKAGGFVGVLLPRTADFPVAAIAIQKCGAGYVPMDPEYPSDRLAYMLENSEAPVLVTTHRLAAEKSVAFEGETVFLDGFVSDPAANPVARAAVTPDLPAYMIYTSGSTGRPKGVVLPHRALRAMIAWTVRDFGLGPGKRNLSITSFSFDASVPDLFPPLAAGCELHVLGESLRKDLEGIRDYAVRVGATGLTTSTQLGLALVNAYPELPLEYMMLGGEKMVPFAKTPVRVINGYGPTEFAVCSSYHEVDQSRTYDIPIGRAVANTRSLVVDAFGQPVPDGFTGEIALEGVQLADGYWKLPEKTAAAFVRCPALPGAPRMYLTGDYGRYGASGELEFQGRADFQVKLRGFRIEIGEIEHAAAAFPGIGAVAAEVKAVAGAPHLVLYHEGAVDAAALKAKLSETLTAYMVPDFFVAVGAMPLTPNGKIDRRKLPAPEADDEPSVPPATEAERAVFAVVAETLGTDAFGVTHDFNRLGLTSLGAMSLLAKLKKAGFAVTMKAMLANPTVRQLAAAAQTAAAAPAAAPSRARPKRATYPMSENQRGIYADWLRNPDALQYNVPSVFRFAGVTGEALAAAAAKTIAAHPAFGTRFVEKDGEIVQSRRDGFAPDIPVETLGDEPDAAFFAARVAPFRPDADALCRASVFASPKAAHLLFDAHHTVFDGFSAGILLAELRRALAGQDPVGETYTAFDAALDERDYLESELVAEDDAWFARYLDGARSTAVETSAKGADGRPGEAGRVRAHVPGAAIEARARDCGTTASDWFLAAFAELLRRTGREDDVMVNFVTAGRGDPETHGSVGMFVKTLPVRGAARAKTFAEAVRILHRDVRDLIERERHSFVRLSERLGVRPEIIFAFEGGLFDLPEGVTLTALDTGTVKAPFAATVTPAGDGFDLLFEYDRSMHSDADMGARIGLFANLALNAAAAVASGGDALAAIPLLSPEECRATLASSYGGDIAYDAAKTIVNLVRANAIARPFAPAVTDCERTLTYAALETAAEALAARLAANGTRPGGFVGLMLPRRVAFVVAALATQKCGAGYVPMDSEYPADRLAYMLENSRAAVLVTTRGLFAGRNLDFAGKVVFADDLDFAERAERAPDTLTNLSTPEGPAYMIYTSGSTGKPKGVVIPHRALRHLCAWNVADLGLKPGDKVATHPSFSFDASVIDIFPTLAAGGELHIYREELRKDLQGMRDYIVANGIKGGTMSTQIGMALLDTYPDLPLAYLIVGGEKLMPTAPTRVRIVNGYGPTEFTVCSSAQTVDQSRTGDIPIGRPAPGTWSLVVDRYGHLLPDGFAGELALAGPQLADGYWALPEKTAAVFVPFPATAGGADAASSRPSVIYRTGDLARYGADGLLEYMGRLDFQVKLRGFRIEIGEIEHRAATFGGVKGVAAEVRDVAGAKHLVLYYGSEAPLDERALRDHLAAALTDYMVPDYFMRVEPMPLTPNGKIDRRRLPAPAAEDAEENEYVEPANDTERGIAETYGEILKRERFGATDDFFACGGTSLVGIKAVVALQKRGFDVAYADIFRHKTPRALAAFLTGEAVPAAAAKAGDGSAAFDYGDYDYSEIDRLLMATPTELFDGFRRHSLGDTLLCGATGYLGVHVLKRLLETTDSTVYALVRPKKGVGAEKRLDSQFVYYFGEKVPRRFRDRLAFVEGDITDADLAAKLDGLSVGTVFNCAALVKHYVADDLMDRVNVGGVANLVAWCARSGARLVHASTYSVGGLIRADSAARLDERHLYVGQESDNDYVRTKFLAEREILAAAAAGKVRAKIMRLGNLMGRESDGEFQMNLGANAFVNSLRSYKALGAYPLEELANRIEMSPIDRVAEAVILLATTPDGMVVFHPYNAYPLDMGAVIGAMNRRGIAIDWVSRPEFAARVDALRNDPARAAELQGILHYAGRLLNDRRPAPAPNDWTTTVLYRLGFRWKPAEDNYLANFLENLEGLAAFD